MSITCGLQIKDNCSANVRDIHVTNNNPIIKKIRKPNKTEDFNVPPLEVSIFVGRDDELKQLSRLFFQKNELKVVLSGLPGYGKTEIAKHFIKKCKGDKIKHILWLNASKDTDLEQSFGKISEKLNFEENYEIKEVFEVFVPEETIIVFDNAPDRETILKYETAATNFFCLITSYNFYWENDVVQIKIEKLSFEYGLQILHSKLSSNKSYISKNSDSLNELVVILGQVPLPLQIIGSYIQYKVKIRNGYFDLNNYVQKLKYSQEDFIDTSVKTEIGRHSKILYTKSLYEAMKICFVEISKNELASNLLYICSYLNPEYIFYSTLYEITTISELLENSQDKEETLNNAVEKLIEFSLFEVDFEARKISMHRFVQTIIRYHISKCDENLQTKIYGDCLKLTLSRSHYYHIPSIIMCADTSANYVNTFFNLYSENFEIYKTTEEYTKLKSWKAKCSGLQLILENLIEGRCKISLDKVLVHLKPQTSHYINEFNLLNVATMSDDADTSILELLLTYGPSVNESDVDGHCALHIAMFKWNEQIINVLLDNDANTTLKDNHNSTLLHIFIRGSYYFADIDIEKAKRILNKMRGTQQLNEIKNGCGESLLHEAATAAQPKLVDLLIHDFKIDANIQDLTGDTPLHNLIYKAASHKMEQQRVVNTIKKLVANKARVDIPNNDDKTPLAYVTLRKIDYLIQLFNSFIAEEKESGHSSQI